MRVLVTGGAGWTARPLVERLAGAGHRVYILDPAAPAAALSGVEGIRGDMADGAAVTRAARDVDAIVHLAVATGPTPPSPELSFRTNVLGTYCVLAAARDRACPLVLVSSAAVHLDLEPVDPRPWRSDPGEDHLYDLTKRLQEEIAADFCATFGLRVTALRAGHVVDGRLGLDAKGRPLESLAYCRGGWVCRRDLADACTAALRSPAPGFARHFVIGASPAYEAYGVAAAETALGFRIAARFA